MKYFLGALALLCLTSCARTGAESLKEAPSADSAPLVPVAKVAREDLSNDLILTAEFEPFQQVDVMAKVAGYVRAINVDIGDRVREGQVLASLEIPEMDDDLRKASAANDQAQAEIATATDDLRRAEEAHGQQRPAPVHHRFGEPRHAHERMAGNVHRTRESFG